MFHMERRDDEEVHHFITCVKEDAKFAECDKLPLNDIVTLIVVSRCRVPYLAERWGMKKEIDLQQIIIDADLYVRNKKVGKQPEHQTPSSAGQTDQGVNFVSGVPNDKRGKGKGKGKNRGRGGNTNRGGYNNGDYQGYQETANQGPPRQSGSGYNYSGCQRVRVITNLPNILTKINKGATMVKGDIMVIISSIKTDSRVEMIKGVQVIVVAITAALVEVMQIHLVVGIGNVSAVMGPLTISMGSAIGKITALQT